MKILLDENIPVQLKAVFRGHEVQSVNDPSVGWKNIQNGLLLKVMEGRFDVLITADRNMYAQQNLMGRSIAIVVLPTNRRNDVLALSELIATIVDGVQPATYKVIERSGAIQTRSFVQASDGSQA